MVNIFEFKLEELFGSIPVLIFPKRIQLTDSKWNNQLINPDEDPFLYQFIGKGSEEGFQLIEFHLRSIEFKRERSYLLLLTPYV